VLKLPQHIRVRQEPELSFLILIFVLTLSPQPGKNLSNIFGKYTASICLWIVYVLPFHECGRVRS